METRQAPPISLIEPTLPDLGEFQINDALSTVNVAIQKSDGSAWDLTGATGVAVVGKSARGGRVWTATAALSPTPTTGVVVLSALNAGLSLPAGMEEDVVIGQVQFTLGGKTGFSGRFRITVRAAAGS